jgi:hypothetical protein
MRFLVCVALVALASATVPVLSAPAVQPPNPTAVRPVAQPSVVQGPTNADLLGAINDLQSQVAQLHAELRVIRADLETVKSREADDYQKTSWRIVQACKIAYLRSYKAGDNPSSGQGGNPFLPEDWCNIGNYPYWKSMQ